MVNSLKEEWLQTRDRVLEGEGTHQGVSILTEPEAVHIMADTVDRFAGCFYYAPPSIYAQCA